MEAAEALGVDLTVVSERDQVLSDHMGGSFLLTDLAHPDGAADDIAGVGPFDAVIAPDDQGVLAAALAAERLGLPHNPPSAVAATRNKVALRRALRGTVRQPVYQVLEDGTDAGLVAGELGFPVVLKPLSRSGSQGVIRADDAKGARAAASRIRHILAVCGENPGEPLLVERFVPGPEIAVEAVLADGELRLLAVFDKPDPLDGPFFEETIYVAPSRLHPEVLDAAIALVAEACGTLGLETGPVHAELRIDAGRPVLIEVAARPIGGRCGQALHFGLLGTSLEALLLRAALDRPLAGLRLTEAVGALMIPIPRSGVLRAVRGLEAAAEIPGVTGVELSIPIGTHVQALPDGDRYLGFAFAAAEEPADVEAALRTVQETVVVEVD